MLKSVKICDANLASHCYYPKNIRLKMQMCGVAVITTAQLHSAKPELMFCTGSNPADVV